MDQLKKFINTFKVKKDNVYTHTGIGELSGSYQINDIDDLKQFYDLYKNVCFDQKKLICITEKPLDTSYLRIDVDFNYDISDIDRNYTHDNIMDWVKIHNKIIKKYVDDPDLTCFVLEKQRPKINNGVCKDGFHLQYPYLVMPKNYQYAIRNDCIDKMKKDEILDKMSIVPLNKLNDIYDKSVILYNNWCLYGSSVKQSSTNIYKLTKIYDEDLNELDINQEQYSIEGLISLFSLRLEKKESKLNTSKYEDVANIFENISVPKNKKKCNKN
jgi:hypothetical protein